MIEKELPKEPGSGWRFLEYGELLKEGDEAWTFHDPEFVIRWIKIDEIWPGQKIDEGHVPVRRRIPASYMLAQKYRGAIEISSIRILSEKEASDKAKSLRVSGGWSLQWGWSIWKLNSSRGPDRLLKKDLLKLYNM